jgi:hypothetical protein
VSDVLRYICVLTKISLGGNDVLVLDTEVQGARDCATLYALGDDLPPAENKAQAQILI